MSFFSSGAAAGAAAGAAGAAGADSAAFSSAWTNVTVPKVIAMTNAISATKGFLILFSPPSGMAPTELGAGISSQQMWLSKRSARQRGSRKVLCLSKFTTFER